MVTVATYPLAPTTTPQRGTLLQTASVSDEFAWLDGTDLYDSYNCMTFRSAADFCAPNAKTFDNAIGWVDGFRFAAYGGAVCKAVGLDFERMVSEVRRVFEQGESVAVEQALMATRFIVGTDWAAPEDITPAAGAVAPEVGIALLEGHAGPRYVGVPTLHVPRTIASLVLTRDVASFNGDRLETKLGSKLVAGSGYEYPNTGPTGAAAAVGERWLYATGEVLVTRSEPIVRQVVEYSDNDVFVLAERGYIAAVDCYAAAVRVTIT